MSKALDTLWAGRTLDRRKRARFGSENKWPAGDRAECAYCTTYFGWVVGVVGGGVFGGSFMGRNSGCLSPALRAITVGPVVYVVSLVPVPVSAAAAAPPTMAVPRPAAMMKPAIHRAAVAVLVA